MKEYAAVPPTWSDMVDSELPATQVASAGFPDPVLSYARGAAESSAAIRCVVVLWLWVIANIVGGLALMFLGVVAVRFRQADQSTMGWGAMVVLGLSIFAWGVRTIWTARSVYHRELGAARRARRAVRWAKLGWIVSYGVMGLLGATLMQMNADESGMVCMWIAVASTGVYALLRVTEWLLLPAIWETEQSEPGNDQS